MRSTPPHLKHRVCAQVLRRRSTLRCYLEVPLRYAISLLTKTLKIIPIPGYLVLVNRVMHVLYPWIQHCGNRLRVSYMWRALHCVSSTLSQVQSRGRRLDRRLVKHPRSGRRAIIHGVWTRKHDLGCSVDLFSDI